jgi:hypothetical protein
LIGFAWLSHHHGCPVHDAMVDQLGEQRCRLNLPLARCLGPFLN